MPTSSSGRSARCSASAWARLAASSGSSRAAMLHLSTPPEASSLDTFATAAGQVSQNVVGNGSPSRAIGACSVTAGRPNGQRTTTRRKARGSRPSWRSTTARSLSITVNRRVGFQPGLDALDDEEVLAGADVAEAARLAREAVEARVRLHALLELAFLS